MLKNCDIMRNSYSVSIARKSLTAVVLTAMMVMTLSIRLHAQVTVLGGTTVKVNPATSVNSTENMVLNSGGTLDVQGTLILKKNLVNQNASANSLGTGTVVFSGTTNQTISGQNIIQNLTVNNAAGLTVGGATRVNGIMTLTSGLVDLGANSLLLGPSATVSGTPSATNMVVATGAGELRKEFASASSFTYPVGDNTGTAEYSPVTLTFNSGTFGVNNYAGVNLTDAQYPGTGTSYLTRYWTVSSSGITNFSANTTYSYTNADVTGNEADIFCFRVLAAPFTAYNAANTGANTIDAKGLSAFGTFTGNLGNGTTPPAVRSLQDKTISGGPECADATQTLLIAGNGTTYTVTSTGNVTHIAGQNILYYPGTSVAAGGYLLGKISTTYCNPYVHPVVQTPVIAGTETHGIGSPDNSFFKIYPNPTPGKFTLELKGDITSSQVKVEIFGVLGDRILSREMQIDRRQEFSLADKPVGVYVIHVSAGNRSETEKIIKR